MFRGGYRHPTSGGIPLRASLSQGGGGRFSIRKKKKSTSFYLRLLCLVVVVVTTFYAGILSGMHSVSSSSLERPRCRPRPPPSQQKQTRKEQSLEMEEEMNRKVQGIVDGEPKKQKDPPPPLSPPASDQSSSKKNTKPVPRFSKETANFAVGMVRIKKKDFVEAYDYGFPESYDDSGSEEVLLLYNGEKALPTDKDRKNAAMYDEGIGLPMMGVGEATENCEAMNVIMTQPGRNRQCLAVMGNYESYHLQRWMKTTSSDETITKWEHVGRGRMTNGRDEFVPPSKRHTEAHWETLKIYFDNLDETLKKLKPVVQRAASKSAHKNTVVVMVCNLGQSVLLTNFVCACQARKISVDNVLVFATDKETFDIAEGLGLAAFYDEKNFADIPTNEAGAYGDRTFVAMMYAKVVSVQLVSALGYDFLFQDVDVVWYRDPLGYLTEMASSEQQYDVLFQDDGARSLRYAPYCANTGFYFVKNNLRTQYFLTSVLYAGDLVASTASHQQALNALLVEHSSLYGLRVKTLDGQSFPGGFHYHRRKDFMKAVAQSSLTPWIFHMSWTKNKDNKLLFMKQMGMWYTHDDKNKSCKGAGTSCCSHEALVSCHYRDKPSVVPCHDSPAIDTGGKDFWTH